MSCYHPNAVLFTNGTFSGFLGKASDKLLSSYSDGQEVVLVPCGQCAGCRLDRSKRWSDRLLMEFVSTGRKALFLTLTYDDFSVPLVSDPDGLPIRSLNKRDFQLFIKRLRRYFSDHTIRYFFAGEYGDHTFRPHGHAIIFGLTVFDFPDFKLYSDTKSGLLFSSSTLNDIWSKGTVLFSEASSATFKYVSRYVLKKQFGSDSYFFYRNRVPPFILFSNKPALGSQMFSKFDNSSVLSLSDGQGFSDLVRPPRLYFKKLSFTNPDLFDNITLRNRFLAKCNTDFIRSKVPDYFQYLHDSEISLRNKTNLIFRRCSL